MTRGVRSRCVLWLLAVLPVVACGDGAQTGTPGLEPPRGRDDAGNVGGEHVGQSGGHGGSAGSRPPRAGPGAAGTSSTPGGASDGGVPVDASARSDASIPDDASAPVDSPICAPVGETLTREQLNQRGENCGRITSPGSLVPNADGVFIEDLPLVTPLQPGQPFAISLVPPKSTTPGSLEIWGSENACGPVDELLWFGDMDGRSQCVELMPTRPHSRLQFVSRELDVLRGIFTAGPGTVTLCPTGSCPGGSDGHPLAPGVELSAPVGVYHLNCYSWFGGHECVVATAWGRTLLVHDEARSDERNTSYSPIGSGAFRMPPTDRHGDAWYCVGSGSDFEESSDNIRTETRLRNITRLPACAAGSESASFSWTGSGTTTDITSSLPAIAATNVATWLRCSQDTCRFRFTTGQTSSTHLYVTFDAPLTNLTAPTELSVLDAQWFTVPDGGLPLSRTCTTSGTVQYDPNGPSTLQLSNLGAFVSCPGEKIANDTLDFVGD